jgi:hypothetical protein
MLRPAIAVRSTLATLVSVGPLAAGVLVVLAPGSEGGPDRHRLASLLMRLAVGLLRACPGGCGRRFPGPPLESRLQRPLHLVLNLLLQWLQRFVNLALHLLPGQLAGLLHLLPHDLGDLALQLAEDRLDGLTDLLLKRLAQALTCCDRLSLVTVLLRHAVAGFRPFSLPRPSGFPSGRGSSIPIIPFDLLRSLPAAGLLLVFRLPRRSRLLDGHAASFSKQRSGDRHDAPRLRRRPSATVG